MFHKVITDRKIAYTENGATFYTADIINYSDYTPYGVTIEPRSGVQPDEEEYRYGFQGQEEDDEIKGDNNSLNYEYRMHDPRIGRFFAVDPLAPKYAYNSPYAFSENRVVDCVELEGLECYWSADGKRFLGQVGNSSEERRITSTTNEIHVANAVYKQNKGLIEQHADWYAFDGKMAYQNSVPYGKGTQMLSQSISESKQPVKSSIAKNAINVPPAQVADNTDIQIASTRLETPQASSPNLEYGQLLPQGGNWEYIQQYVFGEYRTYHGTPINAEGYATFIPITGTPPAVGFAGFGSAGSLLNASKAARGVGLTGNVAKTFRFGRYTEVTLDKPMVLSRYYDNINAFAKGRFMTNSTSSFTSLDRMGMAIRPSWNNMTKVAHWEIPAGTTIYQGRAAMQFPWSGGKTQYFVPELGNIKRVIR